MALSSEQKKIHAQELYISSDLNQNEICEIVGITDKTLRDWREKGGWEELRKSQSITTPKIVALLKKQLLELIESEEGDDPEKKDVKFADKVVKLSASIEKLRAKKIELADYIWDFKELTEHLFERDKELARSVNIHMQDFVKGLMYGKD